MLGHRVPAAKQIDRTAEFVGLVRKYYQSSRIEEMPSLRETARKAGSIRVLNRSKTVYVSQGAENEQGVKVKVRRENRKKGHFCPFYLPYKCMGDVTLNTEELVLDVVHDCLSDEFFQNYIGISEAKNKYVLRDTEESQMKQAEEHADISKSLTYFEARGGYGSAGMDDIKRVLRESDLRIVACRAGQPYLYHIRQCQAARKSAAERKARENSAGNMVVKKLSRDMIDAALLTEPIVLAKSRASVLSRSPASSRQSQRSGSSSVIASPRTTNSSKVVMSGVDHKVEDVSEEDTLTRRHRRRLTFLLQKLEYVYHILCSLYNITNKMLKSQNPLTAEQLSALRCDPFSVVQVKTGKTASIATLTVENSLLKNSTALTSPPGTSSVTNLSHSAEVTGTVTGSRQSESVITTGTIVEKMAAVNSPSHKGKKRGTVRTATIPESTLQVDVRPVEVWEDFLNAGSKKHQHVRRSPPWQRPISPTSEKVNKKNISREYESNPALSGVRRFQTNFSQCKKKIQKQVANELDKLERQKKDNEQLALNFAIFASSIWLRTAKGRYKIKVLNSPHKLPPLFELLKPNLQHVPVHVTKGLVSSEQRVPPWFQALQEDSKNVKCIQHPTVADWLHKLEAFTQDNVSVLPHFKEKLCLVTHSLPIHEICLPAVQHAIAFILEHVLEAHPDLLCDWMKERHLTAVQQRVRNAS